MIWKLEELIRQHPIEISVGTFFLGLVLTFLIERQFEKLIHKFRTNKLKKRLTKNSLEAMEEENIFALAHGSPFWKSEDIEIVNIKKSLIVGIPQDFREEFLKQDSNFEFRDSVFFDDEYSIEHSMEEMNIPNLQERITKHSISVAEDLLEKQRAGRLVFNGEMLGIFDLVPENKGKKEDRKLKIRTFETDFFTYRVFASIYQELRKESHPISQVKKREEIIKYKPFLGSFGLCTFVLLYNQSEVILAKRSLYTTHSENKWHFSVNEAFSQSDYDHNNNPDLFECHVRGLEEELNINPRISKKTVYFLDVLFGRDKFEMGISSMIYLPDFAFQDLKFFYSCAKDGEVESDGLEILKLTKKSVKEFMKNKELTGATKLALQMLLARALNNKLPLRD